MIIYQYLCKECNILWDKEYETIPKRIPKYIKCINQMPNKEVLCNHRAYREYTVPNLKFVGLDFWTIRNRERKFTHKGYDKDMAQKFYKDAIAGSKRRIKDGRKAYAQYKFTDEIAKSRGARRKSDREVEEGFKRARKLTEQTYDKAQKMGYDNKIEGLSHQ